MTVKVTILRADGHEEVYDMPEGALLIRVRDLIGARALHNLVLADGRVLLLDEHPVDEDAVNAKATALYGDPRTHLVGDIALLDVTVLS